jgi:hypothetical protein
MEEVKGKRKIIFIVSADSNWTWPECKYTALTLHQPGWQELFILLNIIEVHSEQKTKWHKMDNTGKYCSIAILTRKIMPTH